jgi:hypothetical protein
MDDAFRIEAEQGSEPPRPSRPARWLRWIIAGNPFYPLSAALLLFGINRLSIDPTFLAAEEDKLLFNFSALELYEILLVSVALLLARRHIRYDSTLLVVIENGLVLVPFVLITQAVLIGRGMAALFCGAAAVLAVMRCILMRRSAVLMPPRLLMLGATILLFNLMLPFIYRSQMEQSAEDWLLPGMFCWLVFLPVILALGNLLQQPKQWSYEPHRQTWLPLLMLALWVGATAVHLRCIDYISGLPFGPRLVAPMVWVACWTLYFRMGDFTPDPAQTLKAALLALTAIVPFLDHGVGYTYLALQVGNVVLFAMIALRTENRAAWQMLLLSAALVVAGMPEGLGRRVGFSRVEFILGGLVFYFVLRAMFSSNVKLGLAGALAVALTPGFLLGEYPFFHLAIQAGAAFLLVHSFRWDIPAEPGAAQLRALTVVIWTLDSVLWTWTDPTAFRVVTATSLMVLGAAGFSKWMTGCWGARWVPAGAAISLGAAPAHQFFEAAKSSPAGLIAVIGSFLLFGLGTVAALTRTSWNRSESRIDK